MTAPQPAPAQASAWWIPVALPLGLALVPRRSWWRTSSQLARYEKAHPPSSLEIQRRRPFPVSRSLPLWRKHGCRPRRIKRCSSVSAAALQQCCGGRLPAPPPRHAYRLCAVNGKEGGLCPLVPEEPNGTVSMADPAEPTQPVPSKPHVSLEAL